MSSKSNSLQEHAIQNCQNCNARRLGDFKLATLIKFNLLASPFPRRLTNQVTENGHQERQLREREVEGRSSFGRSEGEREGTEEESLKSLESQSVSQSVSHQELCPASRSPPVAIAWFEQPLLCEAFESVHWCLIIIAIFSSPSHLLHHLTSPHLFVAQPPSSWLLVSSHSPP